MEETLKSKPLIEWARVSLGLDFSSTQTLVKRKFLRVNDVIIKNPNYTVKEGDIVSLNNKNYMVTFIIKKDESNGNQ